MSQYGKALYGSSLYGTIAGAYSGYYVTPEATVDPDLGLNGDLRADILLSLPTATYTPNEPEFVNSGNITNPVSGSPTIALVNSGTAGTSTITFVGRGYRLSYGSGLATMGVLKITRDSYDSEGNIENTVTEVISTSGTASSASYQIYEDSFLPYQKHVITLEHDTTSAANSVLWIRNINIDTTDVEIAVTGTQEGSQTYTWTVIWKDESNLTFESGTEWRFNGQLIDYYDTSILKTYRIRFVFFTSDIDQAPAVRSMHVSIDEAENKVAKSGSADIMLKLGVVNDWGTLDYTSTTPEGTSITVCTANSLNALTGTSSYDQLYSTMWGPLSYRYLTANDKKFCFNMHVDIAKVCTNRSVGILTKELDLKCGFNNIKIDSIDGLVADALIPAFGALKGTTSLASVEFFVFPASTSITDMFQHNGPLITGVLHNGETTITDIAANATTDKVRVLVELNLNLAGADSALTGSWNKYYDTPTVGFVSINSSQQYNEAVNASDLGCYGSAVYNEHKENADDKGKFYASGIIGGTRTYLTPSTLGFVVPTVDSVEIAPDYTIKLLDSSYPEINAHIDNTDGITSDSKIVVTIQPQKFTNAKTQKHYMYVQNTIQPETTVVEYIGNAFLPALNMSTDYCFYLTDGLHGPLWDVAQNESVAVTWANPITEDDTDERYKTVEGLENQIDITCDYVDIDPIDWESGEYISDEILVNEFNPTTQKQLTKVLAGEDVLDIPWWVNISDDDIPNPANLSSLLNASAKTPFRVDIVNKSIMEHGRIVDNVYMENGVEKQTISGTVSYETGSFKLADPVTESLTRGKNIKSYDYLTHQYVAAINYLSSGPNDSTQKWMLNTHYRLTANKAIDWSLSYNADGTLKYPSNPPPVYGQIYYVTYQYYKLDHIILTFESPKYNTIEKRESWRAAIDDPENPAQKIDLDHRKAYSLPLYEQSAAVLTLPKITKEYLDTLKAEETIPTSAVYSETKYNIRDNNMYLATSIVHNSYDETGELANPYVNIDRIVADPIKDIVPSIQSGSYALNNREYMMFPDDATPESWDKDSGLIELADIDPDLTCDKAPYGINNMPVLIETVSGEPYRYVSFLEDDLSKFTVYNTEYQTKPLTNVLWLAFSDVQDVVIYNSDGSQASANVEVSGRKVTIPEADYATMSNQIKIKYSLIKSYTFNYEADENNNLKLVIQFSEMPTENLRVTYNDNPLAGDRKLLHWLKFNPIYNHLPYGFIYVTDTPDKTKSIRVQVSPDSILRNSDQYAIITVDMRDEYDNPVTNAHIEFSTPVFGTITPVETVSTQIYGRYVYKYSPILNYSYDDENMTVYDTISGLSASFNIKLKK